MCYCAHPGTLAANVLKQSTSNLPLCRSIVTAVTGNSHESTKLKLAGNISTASQGTVCNFEVRRTLHLHGKKNLLSAGLDPLHTSLKECNETNSQNSWRCCGSSSLEKCYPCTNKSYMYTQLLREPRELRKIRWAFLHEGPSTLISLLALIEQHCCISCTAINQKYFLFFCPGCHRCIRCGRILYRDIGNH